MTYRILIIVVDRANYGRLLPLILAGYEDQRFDIKTCFTGTTLSKKFGDLANNVKKDGIKVDYKVEIEKSFRCEKAMINTISNSIVKMQLLYEKAKPDAILIIGDRYEALGCAIAAVYSNQYLIHLQGGERSSSIDETTRHIITKMAHLHFPATLQASKIITRLGEDPINIINSGCPVGDLILSSKTDLDSLVAFKTIENKVINSNDLKEGYILSCLHPITTGIESSELILEEINKFMSSIKVPIIWIAPNADPGSKKINEYIKGLSNCHIVINLSPINFQILLKNANFAIGNSSSFVRDSSFSGTPVMLLGERQNNRETTENVIHIKEVSLSKLKIAFKKILNTPKLSSSKMYGDGNASIKILEGIDKFLKSNPSKQKTLHYK